MFIGSSRLKIIIACAIFVAAFCLASESLYAGGSLKGYVFDKISNDALIGANIVVLNTSLGASTNVEGAFTIYSIPTGQQTLKISYIGYEPITVQVNILENDVLQQDFRLSPQAIEGEEVIVTAQARGQQEAINQQLASNTISNIVAADRIKELPDASAAESIGRLPGISIDRYNGEATGVAIRGLSPKYNTVSVNGVSLPATNNQDRSVDLSLISSNLLDGIEVKKANTPDMDADALGGTIDLRLREAPKEFQVNAGLQGGYNKLQKYTGNYSGFLSVSNRFLDDDLGIIVGANIDRNNRTADKLNVAYLTEASAIALDNIKVNQFTTRREEAFKNRLGGNVIVDYRIPYGKITGDMFYSKAKTDGTYRQDQMNFRENKHYYLLESNESTMSIYTGNLGLTQDFGWVKYDVGVAATGSMMDEPNQWQWQFNQESGAQTVQPTAQTPLKEVYPLITPNYPMTNLHQVYVYSRKLNERTKTAQFNAQFPFNFSDNISGYVKTGGKARWVNRNFDQDQWGHSGMAYGGFWTSVGKLLVTGLSEKYPQDYNFDEDSVLINTTGWWNLPRFNGGYSAPSNFLGGDYQLGMSPDLKLMEELADIFPTIGTDQWQQFSVGSMGSDYDGFERYLAGYIMAEINIGSKITLIPGVRYDADYTIYSGQTFQAVNSSNSEKPPNDYAENTNKRTNNFLLPMVHLKLQPLEWLRIHLAGTETLTRPDYIMYAPITSMDSYGNTVIASNASLKDARSKNVDISVSVYENYAGLVTVSGFYKKIDNLILYAGIPTVTQDIYNSLGMELNCPIGWFKNPRTNVTTGSTPKINTYINNPSPAQYRGVELDWQTNFWYLPSVFKGLIFNLNWTYIVSEVDLQQWFSTTETQRVQVPGSDPPRYVYVANIVSTKTSRRSRMPGQPAHIYNMTVGYDYKGFSVRMSYIYQSDKFVSGGETNVSDVFTAPYSRWDLAVQQKITDAIQLYANINNLTNTHDESLLGYREINPQSFEYYGQTIDVGIRYKF